MAQPPQAAGRMLERHWGAVFAPWEVQEAEVEHFLSYSASAPAEFSWDIGAATIKAAIRRTPDPKPGPDYAAWRSRAEAIALVVADAMSAIMRGGGDLPEGANLSVMAFLRKAPPQVEVAQLSCDVGGTRPVRLWDTLPKVYALGLDDRLASLAPLALVGQQPLAVSWRTIYTRPTRPSSASLRFDFSARRGLCTTSGTCSLRWCGVGCSLRSHNWGGRHQCCG